MAIDRSLFMQIVQHPREVAKNAAKGQVFVEKALLCQVFAHGSGDMEETD